MRYALISDDRVASLYGAALIERMEREGRSAELFSFPAGEVYKTRQTKELLEDQLLSRGYGRDTTIVALGGGVVTDLVGFLAATFCRGTLLILIPTTLLAVVDASIGGKNGVNTIYGKNQIGTFYFPERVELELNYLKTLPEEEWFNGKVEMIKAGLVADADFFYGLPTMDQASAIHRAIAIKKRIVEKDLFDQKGVRSILNLGHTVGHAIETLSQYKISHGAAVARGIVLECRIACCMGILPKLALEKVEEQLPLGLVDYAPEEIVAVIQSDKKRKDKQIIFPFLQQIGEAIPAVALEPTLLTQLLYDALMLSS